MRMEKKKGRCMIGKRKGQCNWQLLMVDFWATLGPLPARPPEICPGGKEKG